MEFVLMKHPVFFRNVNFYPEFFGVKDIHPYYDQ